MRSSVSKASEPRAFTYTNYEEHAGEDSGRHGAQNGQERPSHSAPDRHTHEEVTDSLFDNGCSLNERFADFIAVNGFYNLETSLVDCQRVCMYRCLRNEAVRQRQPDDPRYKAGAAKQKEVPVESGRFLERELAGLRGER